MSGNYDPTNMRDDRHPLRALGMAFGQRQAMDQDYQARAPQYQNAPLAAQLTAGAPMALGPPGMGGAQSPFGNIAGMAQMGGQIGKGLSQAWGGDGAVFDWGKAWGNGFGFNPADGGLKG